MKTAILLIGVALVGCSGTKKATSEGQARTEQDVQMQAAGSRQSREQESVVESNADVWSEQLRQALETETDEDLRLEMTLYDTARSADSLTGRAPVLAELSLHREKRATTRQNQSAAREGASLGEAVRERERTDSLRGEWTAQGESRSETRLRESEQTTRRTPWWVYAGLVGALTALAVFLRRKWGGRF